MATILVILETQYQAGNGMRCVHSAQHNTGNTGTEGDYTFVEQKLHVQHSN